MTDPRNAAIPRWQAKLELDHQALAEAAQALRELLGARQSKRRSSIVTELRYRLENPDVGKCAAPGKRL